MPWVSKNLDSARAFFLTSVCAWKASKSHVWPPGASSNSPLRKTSAALLALPACDEEELSLASPEQSCLNLFSAASM